MALGLANEWKGQFFTPYDICRAMAAMNLGEDLKSQIEEKGWVSVSDPACGAGALLLAFANECKRTTSTIRLPFSLSRKTLTSWRAACATSR